MKQKLLLLILSLAVGIGYSQAQEITNVRQDGDKLILDYELPSRVKSAKFYYKYQSETQPNFIGEAKKLPAGSGSYIWDLSASNTELTGENLSFSIDISSEPISRIYYIMAYTSVGLGIRAGVLYNNHGFYVAPAITYEGLFGVSVGYTGKKDSFGWYAGGGIAQSYYNINLYGYGYDYADTHIRPIIEGGAIYYFKNKMNAAIGITIGPDGLMPLLGIGYTF